tara:strand:+ start:1308 stop:1508 length:201 start_codon:yes stop_codon:yes gene_type:complete
MYKVYKYDGHYIQGEFISKHTTESAAMKSAKKNIFFKKAVKSKILKPNVIWLDGENNTPVGVITMK